MVIEVGQKMPLSLKLFDNSPIEKVTAHIFTNFGDKLEQVGLHHIESGLYINSDVPMPDVDSVIVVYQVADTEKYADATDTFYSKPKPVDEKFIYGIVESRSKNTDFIIGVVNEITNKK